MDLFFLAVIRELDLLVFWTSLDKVELVSFVMEIVYDGWKVKAKV